jgi:hypothetical protein
VNNNGGMYPDKKKHCGQHGIATIAGLVQVSGSLPRLGFITAESDEARKSATVAIPGPLCAIYPAPPKVISRANFSVKKSGFGNK